MEGTIRGGLAKFTPQSVFQSSASSGSLAELEARGETEEAR